MTSAFVGRRRELDVLERLLAGAAHRAGAVAMLSGEPGIGKTRTAAELSASARARGVDVLWARCYEGPSAPYAPWPEALGDDWPDTAGAPPLGVEDARLRLFETVSRVVCERDEPLVLILDDLHLAQASALQLLEHVAHGLPAAPVLIVGTHADVTLMHSLTRCLAELDRHCTVVQLELEGLSVDEVRALVEAVAGDRQPPELVAALRAETAGNPFFITAVATQLDQHGGIPATIRQAVGGRLARLSVEANRLLTLASAFSAPFEFRTLQAASELPEQTVLRAVDEALEARILQAAGGERYEFAHRLFQHTLYEELSPSRRSRLHRRIVQALEQVSAEDAQSAAELARQYHGSRTLPGAEHGVPYALQAAELAEQAAAREDVVAFLQIAADLGADPNTVLPRLAIAQIRAVLVDEAIETLAAVARRLNEEDAAELLGQAAWELEDVGAPREHISRLVHQGLLLAEEGSPTWARLKLAEYPVEPLEAGPWRMGRWLGYAPEAVRVARASTDEGDYARTLHLAEWRTLEETQGLRDRVRGWQSAAATIHGLSVVARSLIIWHGRFREAEEVCRELLELSERVGSVVGTADAHLYAAHARIARGEFSEARINLDAARGLIEKLGPEHRLRTGLGLADFILAYLAGEAPEDWITDVATARTPPWMTPITLGITALAAAHRGERTRARELLGLFVPLLGRLRPTTVNNNTATALAAEVAWELGLVDFAEPLHLAARGIIEAGVGDYTLTSNELTVARMAGLLGDRAEAGRFFEQARRVLAAEDRRPLLAIVDRDEARVNVSRRAPAGLTRREIEVLRLLAAGRTNKELAGELVLSVHTIERHLANAYRKIGARNRADATAFVLREHL